MKRLSEATPLIRRLPARLFPEAELRDVWAWEGDFPPVPESAGRRDYADFPAISVKQGESLRVRMSQARSVSLFTERRRSDGKAQAQ